MAGRTLPNLKLVNKWPVGSSGWGPDMDNNLNMLDALLFLTVLSATTTVPPGSPAQGDRYIVAPSSTGGWAGNDNKVAVYIDSAWQFLAAAIGWQAKIIDTARTLRFNGTIWAGDVPYDIQVFRYKLPGTLTEPLLSLAFTRTVTFPVGLVGSSSSLKTANTSAWSLNLQKNGSNFGTITYAANTTTGVMAAAAVTTFNAGDILEVYQTALDATAAGLRFALVGYR